MSYLPHSETTIKKMLNTIGVSDIDDLFTSIPEKLRFKGELDLSAPLSERDVSEEMERLSESEGAKAVSFLGAGCYKHYVPKLVDAISSRPEFLTAYTPYQPEVSQGTLQVIFEFQSMVARLVEMDIVNASMYDGATAAAEAVLMGKRIRRKAETVYVSKALHPEYRDVIRTYTRGIGIKVQELPFNPDTGETDISGIDLCDEKIAADAIGVVVQSPNYFGVVEDTQTLFSSLETSGVLGIQVVSEATSFALLKSPGASGASIVAGELQSFGNYMNLGGPHVGFMACRQQWLRQMPGRLAGKTVDQNGDEGYVLTLSTREQHIRREKATSNICSNQGLCALRVLVHLSLLGGAGTRDLALENHAAAADLRKRLLELDGVGEIFSGAPVYNEFVLKIKGAKKVLSKLQGQGILLGRDLALDYPELEDSILLCATEMNSPDDFSRALKALGEVLNG